MRIQYNIPENIYKQPKDTFYMRDVPGGKAVFCEDMDMIMISIENEYWLGFGIEDETIGIIDDDRDPIEGVIIDFNITFWGV